MNVTALIIDDEPLAMAVIENYIKKIPYLHLVEKYDNALDAYEILQQQVIDLIFICQYNSAATIHPNRFAGCFRSMLCPHLF